jgi:hypothetical protein
MPLPMLGSALLFCLVLWFAYGELAQLANAKKSQQQYTQLIYCFYRSFLNTENTLRIISIHHTDFLIHELLRRPSYDCAVKRIKQR